MKDKTKRHQSPWTLVFYKHKLIFYICQLPFFSPYFPKNEDPLTNRAILYQMVALYDYNVQGPEDLEFGEGDTIDILSEGTLEYLFVINCIHVTH